MTATTATGGPTVNQAQGQQPQAGRLVFAFGLLVVLASLAGLLISGGGYQPAPNGLPDAGPVVSWLLPVATSLVFVAAMFTAGWLLHAAFLDADARKGLVSNGGRRSLVRAGIAAGVWVVLALVQAALTLSEVLGVSINEALAPDLLRTYAWDITGVRTVVVGALLALIVSVCSFFTLRLTTATALGVTTLVAIALPALAGHAAGLGNHAIALVNGVAHVVAATVWVGGLIALGTIALPRVSQAAAGVRAKYVSVAAGRFSQLALACVVVLGISGFANAYTRLGSPADLFTSGYGRLVVIKTLLLAGLILAAARIRGRILPKLSEGSGRRSFAKIAVLELGLMALATGLGVALSLSAPTRVDVLLPSTGEVLLGTTYPPEPTAASLLGGWYFDPLFFLLGIAGAAFYLAGVIRLRKRGDHWPIGRTVSWLIGIAVLLWATNSGIARYAEVSVGLHMVQHMTLAMLVPIPLVLGAPITLALRAIHPSPTGGRGPRELILSSIHSGVAVFFTNPVVILVIYSFSLYGLYMTSLFGTLMSNHVGHIVMTTHFLVSGGLLAYVTIGIDPTPRKIPYLGKMMLVMAAIVIHTFFAVTLMGTTTAIGTSWYSVVRPPWLTDLVADTTLGGQIAWGIGEVPALALMLIIGVQWSRSDERESKRRDRYTQAHGDTELEDYNAYLAQLAARDRRNNERNQD